MVQIDPNFAAARLTSHCGTRAQRRRPRVLARPETGAPPEMEKRNARHTRGDGLELGLGLGCFETFCLVLGFIHLVWPGPRVGSWVSWGCRKRADHPLEPNLKCAIMCRKGPLKIRRVTMTLIHAPEQRAVAPFARLHVLPTCISPEVNQCLYHPGLSQ